jgi:superfamily I DNA/RNA helicase
MSSSREMERQSIAAALGQLAADGIKDEHICMVLRTNDEAVEYADWLASTGRAVLRLDRIQGDDAARVGIRVATMHRVKGLEFDAVLIVGYRGPQYFTERFAEDHDAGVVVDTLTNERCLLHVAATRARRYLLVSTLEPT